MKRGVCLLFNFACIIIIGFCVSKFCSMVRIPTILGLIFTGLLLGPFGFNIIPSEFLKFTNDFMDLALIIVLTNAGLSMDMTDLKSIGKPAFFMCFLPALFEIVGASLVGPFLLGLSFLESILLGCILAPVAAAVCVPYMVRLIKKGYGVKHKVPQIIIAGTSLDDVLVMVLFFTFLQLSQGQSASLMQFVKIPISILTGGIIGYVVGKRFITISSKIDLSMTSKTVLFVGISYLLAGIETKFSDIPFSGLLALIVMGMVVYTDNKELGASMGQSLDKIWRFIEFFLFILIGASIDLSVISAKLIFGSLIILTVCTLFRCSGILFSLYSTEMTLKEKVFCCVGYLPKTTIQATLGAVPLSYGLPGGKIILTVSILSILVFAPLGSLLIETTYQKLLHKDSLNSINSVKMST